MACKKRGRLGKVRGDHSESRDEGHAILKSTMARILFCHIFTGILLLTASECLMYDSADVES
jgi:hypothetical protein